MSKRRKKEEPGANVYGPDEPIESLPVEPIEDCNSTQFGSMHPDTGILEQFSLGPWHELRRQMLLFTLHVRPVDGKEMSPRRDPGPVIEKRCDMWIVMLLKLMKDDKMLIPPPKDLRKWLYARGLMALSFIDYEIRNQERFNPPDLKNDFDVSIGSRLIVFWQEAGKERWLEIDPDDPDETSTAE